MLIIERFEDDIVIIENDEEYIRVSRESLPAEASEGDVLVERAGGYEVDAEATKKRREKILSRQRKLWK